MLGAIAGDIIGSVHEFCGTKTTEFPLFTLKSFFTDDTVLTIATAEKLLGGGDYAALYRKWGNDYPDRGYGESFGRWLGRPGAGPYNSFGNGSAMRVSPVGFAFDTLKKTLAEAERSAIVTHDHPEGIKGALATAAAMFLARTGMSKAEITAYINKTFGYDLTPLSREALRDYQFDVTCQGSVPQALACALNSTSYEHAVRHAIALGGDADTQACIAGGLAQAIYGGLPAKIADRARIFLAPEMLEVLEAFEVKYMGKEPKPKPPVRKQPELMPPAKKAPIAKPLVKKTRAAPAAAPAQKPRVVVLDDDARYLKLMVKCLETGGKLRVFGTTDTFEALSSVREHPPLLFISDIVHDKIIGVEMLKLLKQDPATRGVKVWLISGNIPKIFPPDELYGLGADYVAEKPISLERLWAKIDLLLAGKQP